MRKRLELLRAHPQRLGPSVEEKEIEGKIVMLNLQEEIMWKQRSRIQWLYEGDNTQSFSTRRPVVDVTKIRLHS
jgi:hypothetical protein